MSDPKSPEWSDDDASRSIQAEESPRRKKDEPKPKRNIPTRSSLTTSAGLIKDENVSQNETRVESQVQEPSHSIDSSVQTNLPRRSDGWEDVLVNWKQHLVVVLVSVMASFAVQYVAWPGLPSEVSNTWERINNVEKSLDASKANIDQWQKEMQRYDNSFTDVKGVINNLKDNLSLKIEKLQELQSRIEVDSRKTSDTLHMFRESTQEKVEEIETRYDGYKKEISSMQEDVKKSEDSLKRHVTSEMQTVQAEFHNSVGDINKDLEKIQIDLSSMKNSVEKEMQELQKGLDSAAELIKKADETKQALKTEVDSMDGIVEILRENAFNKGALLAVVLFLVMAVFCLTVAMFVICKQLQPNGQDGGRGSNSGRTKTFGPVVTRVAASPPLDNTICIISYSEKFKKFNNDLVKQMLMSLPEQYTTIDHVINEHEDIVHLPHAKLMFMCVEFSSRHVIIEVPGIGQGDIRRTTYDAINKLGATLVILYTHDHDSRQLRANTRFHRDIYCATIQPELKELNRKECFYSVYDKFTPYQIDCLKKIIGKAMQ